MPIVRGGYGYNFYSTGDYGTEGVVHTGSAATSVSSSATSGGYTTTLSGEISCVATSSTSAAANATFSATGLVSSTSSTASIGEQFILKESDMLSYGTGLYGYNAYDNANIQTIVSATSVSSTATGERTQNASASIAVLSSSAAACERVRNIDAFSYPGLTTAASGVYIVSVSAQISAESSVVVNVERVRNCSALQSVTSSVAAIGREKWEPIAYNSVTWSEIAA